MDLMGSPYLMAHGMGEPVTDASTEVKFPASARYYVYARTYNWTSPWYTGRGPGKFLLSIDGEETQKTIGDEGNTWFWQYLGI